MRTMGKRFRRWVFPEHTRVFPRSRGISIAFRTVHLATFGILVGGHVFDVDSARLLRYLVLTILSGVGLIALEVYAAGLYWLFLGKGIMVLVKLALLLMIPVFWEGRVILLLLVVGIASISSHMPARYRTYSLLHRRVITSGDALRDALSAVQVAPEAISLGHAGHSSSGPAGMAP